VAYSGSLLESTACLAHLVAPSHFPDPTKMQCIQSNTANPSAIRIDFRPAGIDFLPLLLRQLPVLSSAIEALGAQTHVDFVLEVCAHAHRLPHQAFGLAFVEGGHDLFAA